ncbi:hypothetical protein E4U55_006530 [Claviceps digitariae]|nr:hypothetical protein E4U55_006530 [Claviceps digitariae]
MLNFPVEHVGLEAGDITLSGKEIHQAGANFSNGFRNVHMMMPYIPTPLDGYLSGFAGRGRQHDASGEKLVGAAS